MSTIRTTTLSTVDGTATVPVNTVVNGSAKAWVNFNGTGTVAIRAAFNVSSITDNGTGDYTVNFTTALVDANYGVVGACGNGSTGSFVFRSNAFTSVPTTTAVRISTANSAFSASDADYVSVSIFR